MIFGVTTFCRLFKEIEKDKLLLTTLDYYALDPANDNFAELQSLKLKGVYKNYSELPENNFDYILLCNVLHEISISEWIDTLNKVILSLKENGYIIIIEDLLLPKGEKINQEGFLILDLECLRILFDMKTLPSSLRAEKDNYKDRIQCAVLRRSEIKEVNSANLLNTLEVLKINTLDKIRKIRKMQVGEREKLKIGREAGFYSQLYINAIIAGERLNNLNLFSKSSNKKLPVAKPNFIYSHSSVDRQINMQNIGIKALNVKVTSANLKEEIKVIIDRTEVDTDEIFTITIDKTARLDTNPTVIFYIRFEDSFSRHFEQTYVKNGVAQSISTPILIDI